MVNAVAQTCGHLRGRGELARVKSTVGQAAFGKEPGVGCAYVHQLHAHVGVTKLGEHRPGEVVDGGFGGGVASEGGGGPLGHDGRDVDELRRLLLRRILPAAWLGSGRRVGTTLQAEEGEQVLGTQHGASEVHVDHVVDALLGLLRERTDPSDPVQLHDYVDIFDSVSVQLARQLRTAIFVSQVHLHVKRGIRPQHPLHANRRAVAAI
mmetsp:Transcript_34742/g.95807  ORF Transcript_34742/g.95807 Transcript_34742/m.95807 type:complete len:208 (-) Transcript_34742:451-1074(-)